MPTTLKNMLLLTALLWWCLPQGAARADAPQREIIVVFRPGTAEGVKAGLARAFGAEALVTAYRDHFRLLRLDAGARRDRVISRLSAHPAIEYAEPNYPVEAFEVNDELYPGQWNFSLINAAAAWEASTGDNVTVAVLDTGVSPFGADGFGGRLLSGYNAFLNIEQRWQDFHSHGTHVAGTIAQETNNGIGGAGIAHSARILPVKVLNRLGFGSNASLAAGIRWAADHGADIINMSLGSDQGGRALLEAVNYASAKGVVIVAASGNNSDIGMLMPVSYPAAYQQVIAVGAVDSAKQRAFYSNGGPELVLAAPGGSPDDPVVQETFQLYAGFVRFAVGWGNYPLMGTSMATPHVSAVAALVKSQHPDWGPDEIRQALIDTAEDLGPAGRDDEYGYGLVDAAAAAAY